MSGASQPPAESSGGWRPAARKAVSEEEQQVLAHRLADRYRRLREALDAGADRADLLTLCRVPRRKHSAWAARLQPKAVRALLEGRVPSQQRIVRFAEELGDGEGLYLGAELLRAWDPREAWPWTPWLLHLETGNGALTLATGTGIGAAADRADLYLRVGERLALIATGERIATAERLETFLAVVYALYSRAMVAEHLSEEFTRVLPGLTETVERLLGLHEAAAVASGVERRQ